MTDPVVTPPTPPAAPAPPRKKSFARKMAGLLWKLAVAVVAIWLVARLVHWNDTAIVAEGKSVRNLTFDHETEVVVLSKEAPQAVSTAPAASEPEGVYLVRFPAKVEVMAEGAEAGKPVRVVIDDMNREHFNLPREMLLPAEVFKVENGEVVRLGLRSLLGVAKQRWYLLVAAWAILIIPFLVTAVRWRNLLRPQGIEMPLGKCLQLTFVGQFYSIILPGITGGDLVKIVYAARLTGSKTKSLITILLDRVIGLVALLVIGGVSAGWQLWENHRLAAIGGGAGVTGDATLRNVVLLICGILGGMTVFCIVYFSHRLRAATGMKYMLEHSRMPNFVRRSDEVMHTYRGHFGLLFWAFAISVLSQLTLPVSAWLSGMAFGVHMHVAYYLSYVPVAILVVSLPGPPQGAGLLDVVIVHFFANRGMATASQAFAIAQAIRFLPLLWNLVGGYWVMTGVYSRHQAEEESARISE